MSTGKEMGLVSTELVFVTFTQRLQSPWLLQILSVFRCPCRSLSLPVTVYQRLDFLKT